MSIETQEIDQLVKELKINESLKEEEGFNSQSDDYIVDVGFVYVIYATETDLPIYVGCTINPHSRFSQHRAAAERAASPLYLFMNKNPFHFKVLKTFNSISNYFLRNEEAKLIELYTNIYEYKLFNVLKCWTKYDSKIKEERRRDQIKFHNDKNSKKNVRCETCSRAEGKEITYKYTAATGHKRSKKHCVNVTMEQTHYSKSLPTEEDDQSPSLLVS